MRNDPGKKRRIVKSKNARGTKRPDVEPAGVLDLHQECIRHPLARCGADIASRVSIFAFLRTGKMGEHMTNPLNLPGSQSNPFSFASRRADAEALTQHWREDEQQGARNSLRDPELADAFESQYRLEALDEIAIGISRSENLSGDALWKKVYQRLTTVDENIRFPDTVGGACFVKGTLVLAKGENGKEYQWKRIEEIKPGDWVLSSPEDGTGKQECKRVTNTLEI
ncbi:MAG: hypothetical protein LBL69_02200, partial [Zoogloeaceae bacterium]|nr:hypothetical protein [Zoogloeaceae bacterium]